MSKFALVLEKKNQCWWRKISTLKIPHPCPTMTSNEITLLIQKLKKEKGNLHVSNRLCKNGNRCKGTLLKGKFAKAISCNKCNFSKVLTDLLTVHLYIHQHCPTTQVITWRLLPIALVVEEADEEEFLLWPVLHQLAGSEHVPWRSGYEHAVAMKAHSGHLWVYDLHKQKEQCVKVHVLKQ